MLARCHLESCMTSPSRGSYNNPMRQIDRIGAHAEMDLAGAGLYRTATNTPR
jgi:hypothetical protein